MTKHLLDVCLGVGIGLGLSFGMIFSSVASGGSISLVYLIIFDAIGYVVYTAIRWLVELATKRFHRDSYLPKKIILSFLMFSIGFIIVTLLVASYIASNFWRGSVI